MDQLTQAWSATDACASDPSTVGNSVIGGPQPYWQSWDFTTAGDRAHQVQHAVTGPATGDKTTTYNYTSSTQPDSLSNTAGALVSSYTSDPVGNVKTRTLTGANLTIGYDYDNRTASIAGPGGTSSYVNDADGNLLVRHDPSSTTVYLPGEELTRNKTSGTITGTRYYSFKGTTFAVRNEAVSSNVSYLLADPHGTNQTAVQTVGLGIGTITRRHFDPYGNPLGTSSGGTWPDSRSFLDKPAVASSGTSTVTAISDVGAREYDATTGRFLSVDPVLDAATPQSLNGYSYANNNPISQSDPSGLMVDDPSSNRCDAACAHGVVAGNSSTYRRDSSTADNSGSCNTPGGARACGGDSTVYRDPAASTMDPKLVRRISDQLTKTIGACGRQTIDTVANCMRYNVPDDINHLLNPPQFSAIFGTSAEGLSTLGVGGALRAIARFRLTGGGTNSGFTEDDLATVEQHLRHPDFKAQEDIYGSSTYPKNDAMIARIRAAMQEGRPLSEGETNFMTHELTENMLMDGGMDSDQAHALALETHPLGANYDPEVIKQFPEEFGPVFFRYWGIPR